MKSSDASTDIYELLGVSADAPAMLAREMYWIKVQPLLALRSNDREAVTARIEALNQALAVISDERLRADYDRRQESAPPPAPAKALVSADMYGRLLPWVGLASAVGFALVAVRGYPVTAISGLAVLLATLAAHVRSRLSSVRAPDPRALRLAPDANRGEIDAIYRMQLQQMLLRLRDDASVIMEIDALDASYASMVSNLAAIQHVKPGKARVAVEESSKATAAPPVTPPPARPPTVSDAVRRRLGVGRGQFVSDAESAGEQERSTIAATRQFSLVLQTDDAAAPTRVVVGSKPLTIGSGAGCDVRLDEEEVVLAEHAVVWRSGDEVILHVTDFRADCLVNGVPALWSRLAEGDSVQIGHGTIKLVGAE
jgi:hypothetical protein